MLEELKTSKRAVIPTEVPAGFRNEVGVSHPLGMGNPYEADEIPPLRLNTKAPVGMTAFMCLIAYLQNTTILPFLRIPIHRDGVPSGEGGLSRKPISYLELTLVSGNRHHLASLWT